MRMSKEVRENFREEDAQNPLYSQLIDKLLERIEGMEVNDRLPSERNLCVIYGVSRTTVRLALYELELNGYIVRSQGRGTFVTKSDDLKQDLSNYYSFTKQTESMGKTPKTKILEFHIEYANKSVQEKLKIESGSKVIRFVRLRFADDVPMMLETTYIPFEKFENLKKQDVTSRSLYDVFENDYNIKINRVVEQFAASNVTQKQADYLDISSNSACLKVTRFSYDAKGTLLEITYSLARSDQFIYQSEINVGRK